MRMKRKKNLDERIAASGDYLITMKNDSLDFQDAIKENHLLFIHRHHLQTVPCGYKIGQMLKLYIIIGNLDSQNFIEIFHVITCILNSFSVL